MYSSPDPHVSLSFSGDEQHNWGPTHSYSSEEEFSTPPHKSKMTGIVGNILKSSLMKSPKSCATTLSKGSTSNQSSKTALTSPVTTSTTTGNSGKDRHYVSPQLAMKTGIHDRTTTMQPSVPGAIEDGSYILSSYNATSAATGTTSVIANFWHNHASPATNTSRVGGGEGMDGQTFAHPPEGGSASLIPPGPPTAADDASTPLSSPLSTSAKAAAEAIVGMISKAETFLVARTASLSSALSGGLCSPQGSSMPMGGDIGRGGDSSISFDAVGETPEEVAERRHGESNDILEATYPTTKNDKITCGQSATNCLDFEEFGFNPFQDGCDGDINRLCSSTQRNVKYVSLSPSILRSSPSTPMHPQKPEGDEIRLKASFNPVKAKRESLLDEQTKQQQAKSGDGFSGLHYWKQNCPDHGNTPQQSDGSRTPSSGLPFREVSVPMELERSVSELTMRSHGAFEMHKYTSDSRRMAYYAMGRVTANCKNKSGGGNDGNRRCYFTGLPILNGVPFYAGSVQQGPRTLVVFCLPSALDLPTIDRRHIALKAERERYLESLPNPDADLLREMSRRYREPFETLPIQVRSSECWRLFVKFCFFSGLPIAEGEMHYRVKSSVVAFTTLQTRLHQLSEEIALSHDVMEGK
jgi:hypothetical protein